MKTRLTDIYIWDLGAMIFSYCLIVVFKTWVKLLESKKFMPMSNCRWKQHICRSMYENGDYCPLLLNLQ